MKPTTPSIYSDRSYFLPRVISDCLNNRETGENRFIHVNWSENIDFYCSNGDWDMLQMKITRGMINDEAGNKLTPETIEPYFEAFSLGFMEGFNELEQQVNSGLFTSDEIRARKIYEFTHWLKAGGFPERGDGKRSFITKELWHTAGIKSGNCYKAWYIIVTNHEPFLKYFEETEQDKEQKTIVKSFSWNGSQAQKEALCEALKGAGYIDQGTTKEAFTAIFSGVEIDGDLHRVIWICKNRKGSANKTALREFLTLLLDKFQDKTVPFFFVDIDKKPISLSKPKRNEYSGSCQQLEDIIASVKELPDH